MVCCATVCQKRNFGSKIKIDENISIMVNLNFFNKIGQKFGSSMFNCLVKIEFLP